MPTLAVLFLAPGLKKKISNENVADRPPLTWRPVAPKCSSHPSFWLYWLGILIVLIYLEVTWLGRVIICCHLIGMYPLK